MAAMAVVFRRYSLELAVDDWASDDEVAGMDKERKAELYKAAQDRSRAMIEGATSILTLKLNEGHIPSSHRTPCAIPSTPTNTTTMTSSNTWLRGQRKMDLVELSQALGLQNYESLKKSELEIALEEWITENPRFEKNKVLNGYYNARNKALTSPVKRESRSDDGLKVARRRATKLPDEITPESEDSPPANAVATATALVQTPARALAQAAANYPLPATPAEVVEAFDRSALVVRQRASSIYQESGITEASNATREVLSTVTSVLFCVAGFELWNVRREVLSNTFAFTVPAIAALGTSDYPVYLPDMFLILTSSFWSPVLTWALTSGILPVIFGYFFNLSASNSSNSIRTRSRSQQPGSVVDPLTFSIAKALVSYVVYAQGVNFGILSDLAIERLNGAVYGGYKGILVGTAITGLVSIYDAVLRK
ncbi:hypothetical protein G7046_g9134 [Stylonectria norvegica]|nr:hypothetical protein G7046_g9134 [Stylonectria norvegica]